MDGLLQLRDEFPCVGDVRGKGLMLGVEMVADEVRSHSHYTHSHSRCTYVHSTPVPPFLPPSLQVTRDPLSADAMNMIWEECRDKGVLFGKGGFYGNVCWFSMQYIICVYIIYCNYSLQKLTLLYKYIVHSCFCIFYMETRMNYLSELKLLNYALI